jgi:hypothetical protein
MGDAVEVLSVLGGFAKPGDLISSGVRWSVWLGGERFETVRVG